MAASAPAAAAAPACTLWMRAARKVAASERRLATRYRAAALAWAPIPASGR
jgi:hypothetical protein